MNVVVRTAGWNKYTGLYTVDGILNGRLDVALDAIKHLILPVITLTTVQIALIIRVMRSSMLEALNKGYIVTARAKGLAKKVVINKHARRNALIPIVTLSGIMAAGMLTGVVITESVFALHGLGEFAASAATQLDIASVLGFALLSGFVFVIANLIVDIVYAFVDPRIRLA
jgi:peptide/nickel transport system permease protein